MDGDTLAMPRYCSPSTIHAEQYIIMSKFSKVMSDYIRSLENISFRRWFTDTTYVFLSIVLIVCQCAFILAVCVHVASEKKKHVHTMHLYANQSGHFHQLLLENTENAEI